MKSKVLSAALIMLGAFAFVVSPVASAGEVKKQMMRGAPDDPNVYCNGGCATNGCCIISSSS